MTAQAFPYHATPHSIQTGTDNCCTQQHGRLSPTQCWLRGSRHKRARTVRIQLCEAQQQPNWRMVEDARMLVTSRRTEGKPCEAEAAAGPAVWTCRCTHMQNSWGHGPPAHALYSMQVVLERQIKQGAHCWKPHTGSTTISRTRSTLFRKRYRALCRLALPHTCRRSCLSPSAPHGAVAGCALVTWFSWNSP